MKYPVLMSLSVNAKIDSPFCNRLLLLVYDRTVLFGAGRIGSRCAGTMNC